MLHQDQFDSYVSQTGQIFIYGEMVEDSSCLLLQKYLSLSERTITPAPAPC